ncbi:hypothetical protein Bca52824_065252 [Brassica carinata]|uniref:DUF1985 domain-containing protein n=1 Tax=Brassica carinata TaxID=52824 RepID=A0A8X7QID8_BRACI|nr:hypothetical protein Bca52824_065252 [Brassica carinata]
MKKSKLSQTTVRRRPRSSGEELPERPPAKQHRYPDSRSEDGPGGGDSSGGQFSDGVPSSVLPRRLFAYGAYPTKLRVNIYSKSHVIGSVAAALKGTDAMDTLMASQFWGLFQLPVVRCQNSTKLIGCLLSRQLVTARRHELWFTFGPDPLRFSLDEFRDVTGLNCGDFDVQDSEASESVPPTMWNKLFDTAVGENPLQVMRDRLSQKTTVCYGFPLALQLFVFDVVPLLLEKIHDAGNTATFIDSPGACSSPSTILTVNEIVAVEEDPDVSVHFTVIPDEERLLLVDQNEDRQVTSLVQKLLCGETFKPDDFPGGDQSFSPKFKVPDAAQGEGACPTPVRQRNLRPRNTTPIEVEDISSSGNSGEENRQCSERCTHENLKYWISQRFEGMENNIEELRTLICKSLVCPRGANATLGRGKRWMIREVRRDRLDDSIVSETEGKTRREKRKTVGTRMLGKTLPRPIRGGKERKWSPNDDDLAKENEVRHARFPPSAGDGQQQETQSMPSAPFGDVLDVESESYVLPAEEDPDGGEEARTADKQPQSVDSVETSNMEFPKPVEAVGKVAPPKAGGEASVKEINAELQGTEDEERYDSFKDDMSTDSQIQENPRDLYGETDADSEDVGSGGEEKVEYKPIAKTNRTQFRKFAEILRENPEQMWDIATGHSVCNHFFL